MVAEICLKSLMALSRPNLDSNSNQEKSQGSPGFECGRQPEGSVKEPKPYSIRSSNPVTLRVPGCVLPTLERDLRATGKLGIVRTKDPSAGH